MKTYKPTKTGCYISNISMSGVILLSPLLFTTFRDNYGISYTLLGLLVLVNFFSQLVIDLIFSFFSKKFDCAKVLHFTPLITVAGLLTYAIMPTLFPGAAYPWIVVGTVIFSISGGLCEVLISPTVAAMPSDTPEQDMSRLHSIYAWGVVAIVLYATAILNIFGIERWQIFPLSLCVFPISAFICFSLGKFPDMSSGTADMRGGGAVGLVQLLPFCLCIFLGGMIENNMSQWCSDYVETAVGLSKTLGDVLGTALFAAFLGLGRSLYARFGKNIMPILICGFAGAAVTYFTAGIATVPVVGLIACVLTGFCVSMLWPGTLIVLERVYPECGVVAYALMAASGDMGSSIGPQVLGIVTDLVSDSDMGRQIADRFGMLPEQVGMKLGMMLTVIAAILGIVSVLIIKRKTKENKI